MVDVRHFIGGMSGYRRRSFPGASPQGRLVVLCSEAADRVMGDEGFLPLFY
nr:hypothetical protein Iba_scaffold156.2CG0660 [Ipomoea batatas]